jgi:hypothetical protein
VCSVLIHSVGLLRGGLDSAVSDRTVRYAWPCKVTAQRDMKGNKRGELAERHALKLSVRMQAKFCVQCVNERILMDRRGEFNRRTEGLCCCCAMRQAMHPASRTHTTAV